MKKLITSLGLILAVLTSALTLSAPAAQASDGPNIHWTITLNEDWESSLTYSGMPSGESVAIDFYSCADSKLVKSVPLSATGSSSTIATTIAYNHETGIVGHASFFNAAGLLNGHSSYFLSSAACPAKDSAPYPTYSGAPEQSTGTPPQAQPTKLVAKWGKVTGSRHVGTKVLVGTPALTRYAKTHRHAVTYVWKVNGHVVGHKRSVRIKNATWKRNLTVTVTVKVGKKHTAHITKLH